MTEAVFEKKSILNFISLIFGLLLVCVFVVTWYKDDEADMAYIVAGIAFGISFCAFAVVLSLFNFKAYLRLNDGHIKGKCGYFGKIDCRISDVDFVSSQGNVLTIQLKNGKRHTISMVANSFELCLAIRRKMDFEIKENFEELLESLNALKRQNKRNIIYVCVGLAFLFVNIFVAVFLTGEREMHEFSKTDWLVFSLICVIELATLIDVFYSASKAGKRKFLMQKAEYSIRRTVIETKPIFPTNVLQVFTDDDYTLRVILYGCPNGEGVYYAVQSFGPEYTLTNSYKSETYEDIEYIPVDFESLVDITEVFLGG